MPKTKTLYEIELNVNNQVIKSTGATILEALEKLELPVVTKTLGYMYIRYGDKKLDKLFPIRKLRLLQKGSKYVKMALAKNLSMLMDIRYDG
jgi:hypothetical protein